MKRGLLLLVLLGWPMGPQAAPHRTRPNVLVVTIDTLRVDALSGYGASRQTTPHLDALMAGGVRFDQARTVEPLTTPALASMLTSLYPHEHGATRNGLRMRPGLESLPKVLARHGWATAAVVGNWTLKDRLSGLGEHFGRYAEVFTRKRWMGIYKGESTAEDLSDEAIAWLRGRDPGKPFFLWVHYVDPHAPYRLQPEEAARLRIGKRPGPRDRYETEVAFADLHVGRLLQELSAQGLARQTLVVFAADHGESLGEHGYWGHGRNLFEETLHIPMALSWPGTLPARTVSAPALNLDLAPTVLGLVGLHRSPGLRGVDWTPVLLHGAAPDMTRVTFHQAHKGAVVSKHASEMARRSGLLEVGLMAPGGKEVFRIDLQRRALYDLASAARERGSLVPPASPPSAQLLGWMKNVYAGLTAFDADPHAATALDQEAVEALKSLGYVE
jgi:arylsulfatase A-like enzyme